MSTAGRIRESQVVETFRALASPLVDLYNLEIACELSIGSI